MHLLKRNRNFFLLWQGQLVSQIGSKIYLIALSWYFVAKLNNNQGFITTLLVSSLPYLLFGFIAGPLVEKWNKKWIIFCSDYISAFISFVLAGLIYWQVQNPIFIYITVFLLNVSIVFFNPAVSSVIPSIVSKDEQQEAISLNTTVQFGAQFLGAALGGILVAYIGVFYAILLNAVSFFLSAFSEMFIKYNHTSQNPGSSHRQQLKEGLLYIIDRSTIAKTFVLFSVTNIFLIPITVYLPILIENYLKLGANAFGFAESGLPIGAIIASLYFAKKNVKNNLIVVKFSILLISIPFFLIFAGKTIFVVVPAMIIFGLFLNANNINAISMYTREVEAEYHGRFFTLLNTIAYGTFPLAYLLSMLLVKHLDLYVLILANGLLIVVTALIGFKTIGNSIR